MSKFEGTHLHYQPARGEAAVAKINSIYDRLEVDLNEVLGVGPDAVMAFETANQSRTYALDQVA